MTTCIQGRGEVRPKTRTTTKVRQNDKTMQRGKHKTLMKIKNENERANKSGKT